MSKNILGIHHCSVIVKGIDDALFFYVDILGLKKNNNRPQLGYPGAWLDAGEQQIHLLQLANPDPTEGRPQHGGRDRHVALLVNSLGEVIVSLEKAGIDFSMSQSGRRALFCRDPDANAVEIVEFQ